ncbi:hypothetical protein LOK49_LG03G03135 [Camellia lanceoleosa]|uniref:Uncharacterized protein n=1 Tax=Camellia lanceoleosa TaxID=1840588 RepID=A0ACC0I8Y2_9ERIC|nr:hypothetical protein LOK49_LG03G03135 [Camellia lanceoleosa]
MLGAQTARFGPETLSTESGIRHEVGIEGPSVPRRIKAELRVWQGKVNNNVCVLPNNVVGNNVGDVMVGKVVDVETATGGSSKFSGFGINNKHIVWKMMTEQEKDIISSVYDQYDDDNAIYFSDVKAIVRQGVVRGNVSYNGYELNAGKDFPKNSFFFSAVYAWSVCCDMMKNDNVVARNNYVMSNLSATKGARYINFPICHLFHWTLVVYDTYVGSWKHYNSMRSRNESGGAQYAEAMHVVNPRQFVAAEHEMFILRGDVLVAKDRLDVSGEESRCDGYGKNEMEGCKVGGDGGKKVANSSNTSSEDRGNLPETPKMCGQSTMLRPDVLCGGEQLGSRIGMGKIVGGVGGRLVSCDQVESDVNEFGMSNINKDEVIAKLEEEVIRLKKKNDMQAVHIVEGFESVFKVKDEEKKKLQLENAKLRQTIAILEEQLADQTVHNVTQQFKVGDLGHEGGVAGKSGCGYKSHGGKQHSTAAYAEIVVDASPITYVPASSKHIDSGVIANVVQYAKHQVVVIDPVSAEGGHVVGAPNSFMRSINEKVQKNLQLPEFDYPELRVRQQKVNSNVCMLPNNVADNGMGDVMDRKVVDVETAIGGGSKFSGFGINNKHTVWKMMTEQEKDIISSAYDRYGDDALMWIGRGGDNAVYFSDVKAIVRQDVVRGNVIDAYAEVLSDEQTRLNVGKDFPENSFFFSSICLDMMKNDNVAARNNYIMSNLSVARGARYIHFPICHLFHWTLVVYDTNVGSWKHYNSMRPRNGSVGEQYAEAMHVRNIVTEVQRQSLVARGMDDLVATQDFDIPLESVVDCPQQRPEALDCAIIVCAIMRQYVHHIEVGRSLEGGNCSVLRANMERKLVVVGVHEVDFTQNNVAMANK